MSKGRALAICLFSCSLAVTFAGCSGGRAFVRPNASDLILGKTTEQEVRQRMGDPPRQGTMVKNGETLTTLSYAYALAYPYVDDVKVRAMGFYFLRGVLAGYEFTSSFKEDKTRFDEGKVAQIRRGESKRDDIVVLLGQPTGLYSYPLIKEREAVGLVYFFIDSERHPFGATVKQSRKFLIVSCDNSGIVTDITYDSSEPK